MDNRCETQQIRVKDLTHLEIDIKNNDIKKILQTFTDSEKFYNFLHSLTHCPEKIDRVLDFLTSEELDQLLTRGTKSWTNRFEKMVTCIRSLPEAQQMKLLEKWGKENLQRETRSFKQLGFWVDKGKEPIVSLFVFSQILNLLGTSYLKSFFQEVIIPECSTPHFSKDYFHLLFNKLGGEVFLKEKIRQGYDFSIFLCWFPEQEEKLAPIQRRWEKNKRCSLLFFHHPLESEKAVLKSPHTPIKGDHNIQLPDVSFWGVSSSIHVTSY